MPTRVELSKVTECSCCLDKASLKCGECGAVLCGRCMDRHGSANGAPSTCETCPYPPK